MAVFKILVTGTFGSGKTTFVKSASQIDPLLTEKKISHPHEFPEKETTTVAMDMGKIKIDPNTEVHIFATPGQKRFDFMFDILSKGIIGAIILVDATDPASIEEALEIYKRIKQHYDIPVVFGVTKLDLPESKDLEEIMAHLEVDDYIKVVPVDARNKEDVKRAIIELLQMV
ncbi:MAG: GTP-binding protein [Aquificae bacterium]|nr:GTP-binding protein [Aquificota bacterium]